MPDVGLKPIELTGIEVGFDLSVTFAPSAPGAPPYVGGHKALVRENAPSEKTPITGGRLLILAFFISRQVTRARFAYGFIVSRFVGLDLLEGGYCSRVAAGAVA